MKRIFKYLMMMVLASATMFYSCETTELEDLASPNSLSPDLADADLLLNNIQIAFLGAMQDMQYNGAALGRISYMGGRVYYNNFGSGTISGAWYQLYASMMPDIAAIEGLNGDGLFDFHLGISYAMAAHVTMGLVDSVGDIPFAQANDPVNFPSPSVSDDADVYAGALAMLDMATDMLSSSSGDDMFYGGDAAKWTKYVNTLKLRANLTLGNWSDVVNATNVIESSADDMQFNYGTQELQPDTRHPWYQSDYTTSGANIYQSSWLMDLMDGDQAEWANLSYADHVAGNHPINDPRRRYYFYRQTFNTPGQQTMLAGDFGAGSQVYMWPCQLSSAGCDGTANGETLQCSLQDQPFHLEFTQDGNVDWGVIDPNGTGVVDGRWCSNFMGYWGRHHGNDEGTPPDNFTRTAVGVYPAGGSYDNMPDVGDYNFVSLTSTFNAGQVWQGNGGGGQGIWPIYLSSYVKFMKAEANMWMGNAAAAAVLMEAGMNESITKVMSMGSVDAEADASMFPTATMVSAYVADVMAQFAAAATADTSLDGLGWPVNKSQLDILGEQYFIAMYGGANDAWNFIRRTGHPRTLARGLMDNTESGPFPRTGTYPSSEISANPNILQRQDNLTTVFWDQGVTNPAN